MKSFLIGLFFAFIGLFAFVGCDEYHQSADEQTAAKQEQIQREAEAQTGLPAIHNYQEKKLVKQIYELRDQENLVCYAYLFNEFNGKLIFIGKCIGYGLPYSVQYSNPEKTVWQGSQVYGTLPQAEPNGLFMPSSAEGTWVMLLDTAGTPHPVYVEPRVIVSPFKLSI